MTWGETSKIDPKPFARAALSIDLEDFYHANYPRYNYRKLIGSPSRLIEPTEKMLDVFDQFDHKVTFFVLGEVARQFPWLIKKISACGHEIATHGENHFLITELGEDKTIQGLRRAVGHLEDLTGEKVYGYRAPNFSASPGKTPWLFEELVNLGLRYDSSRFPAKAYYGGEPRMQKTPFVINLRNGEELWEIPVSCSGPAGFRLVWSGGFYWRVLPLSFIVKKAEKLIDKGNPVILYLHPKDIDSENPSLPIGRISNWIHQVGTGKGYEKLERMASQMRMKRIIDLIPENRHDKKQEKREYETTTAMV